MHECEGNVYQSNNCGKFIVIKYKSYKEIIVKFLDTGSYVTVCSYQKIKSGSIKDPMRRSVFGVGYHGVGKHDRFLGKRIRSKCYSRWMGILNRCYNEKCENYYMYGGSGVRVCEEWHNFQNFAEWYTTECKKNNVDRENNNLHIDKDILSCGDKIYSPETCCLVTLSENNVKARAKVWKFKDPTGKIIEIYNLAEFCRENGLVKSSMRCVYTGRQNQHKGYTSAG